MKSEIKKICLSLLFMSAVTCVFSASGQQKIFLFLSQPLEEGPVVVHLNKTLENTIESQSEQKPVFEDLSLFKISFSLNENAKRTIAITIPQAGFVQLDAFDLHGKKLGVLMNSACQGGTTLLEENENWKSFTHFRGITYLILTVDGMTVIKKLIPKVD